MFRTETVSHTIPAVWNSESRILILGTMPSPKSREAGFFYMHPQNRFWSVLSEVFNEKFEYANNGIKYDESEKSGSPDKSAAVAERRDFLLRHNLAMWDVLASCEINGASDASIKNEVPNDFTEILEKSRIKEIICTGKTAYALWKKYSAALYEPRFRVNVHCLPSTSPANAQWSKEKLISAYKQYFNDFFI